MIKNFPKALQLVYGATEILAFCPTGASHVDRGEPCQDASFISQQFYKGYPYAVLAVADGHGSEEYSRSEIGSHFAVEAASNAASDLVIHLVSIIENSDTPNDWSRQIQAEIDSYLSRNISRYWKNKVCEHARSSGDVNPESEESIKKYGSTLAVIIIFNNLLITANLGDGSIFLVRKKPGTDGSEKIEKVAPFLPELESGLGLSTDSLCSQGSKYKWQTRIFDISDYNLSMIFMTTDGLTDSVENSRNSIESVLKYKREHGLAELKEIFPEKLSEWSDKGVGDDMGCIAIFLPEQEVKK